MEESRIREARCNKKYKEIRMWIDRPSYLRRIHLDWIEDGRALMMMRCGNME